MMQRFWIRGFHLTFAASIAAGCAPERPIAATPPTDAAFARPTAAYTATDIGALFDGSSQANGVNDAGEVVGELSSAAGLQAFAVIAGVATLLPGGGRASGISNSSPRYVVGFAGGPSQPVRWTVGDGTASGPTFLAMLTDEVFGEALGVNDAGAAAGRAGPRAAMWSATGERTSVPPPEGRFVRGEGRDINNAGHAVLVFFDGANELPADRGYVRLASGQLVELPPLPGDVTTYANNLSEVVNNAVYVAGTTWTGPVVFRGVRWTVDVTTGAVLSTEVRPENAHALDVSNAGATAGFLDAANSSLKTSAFLWRGSEFLSLKPPKRGINGVAWAMSPNGAFVVGRASFGLTRHAVLWTIATP